MDETSNKNFKAVKQNFEFLMARIDKIDERVYRMENSLAILQAEIQTIKQLAATVTVIGPTAKH